MPTMARLPSYLCSAMVLAAIASAVVENAVDALRPTLSPSCRAYRTAARDEIKIIQAANKAKGLGAFATQSYSVGDYIGEYDGELLTKKQVQARYWGKRAPDNADEEWAKSRRKRGQGITGTYVFEMDEGSYFVDAEDGDKASWCRFMNHAPGGSAECNVRPFDRITTDGDLLKFPRFFAIEDIQEGDELCWDYGPSSSAFLDVR